MWSAKIPSLLLILSLVLCKQLVQSPSLVHTVHFHIFESLFLDQPVFHYLRQTPVVGCIDPLHA